MHQSRSLHDPAKYHFLFSFAVVVLTALILGSTFNSVSAYATSSSSSSANSQLVVGNHSTIKRPSRAIQEASSNATELGCCSVHAYSGGSYSLFNQTVPDSSGNYVSAEVVGVALNPLSNGDPNFDYYIFDVYASVSSASYNNWWVDSNGLTDSNGPSLRVNLYSCYSASQTMDLPKFQPSTLINDLSGSSPVTNSISIGYGGFSFGLSNTFTPPISETEPTNEASCYVSWSSGANTNANPPFASYAYDFQVGEKVLKGQPATIGVLVEGSLYQPCGIFCGHRSDYPYTYFTASFITPPITTVTSSPPGANFVQVDGTAVTTPAEFVWDEGNLHTITASQTVAGGTGIQYSFSSWNDAGAISHNILAPTVLTDYVANFQKQDQLQISPSANCQTSPPSGSYWYNVGQIVTVKSIPNPGFALNAWLLDGVDAGNASQILISMTATHSLAEVCVPVPTLKVTAQNGGTVSVQSSAIDGGVTQLIPSGASVTYSVPSGSKVTLTASPSSTSYSFLQWSGSQSSVTKVFSFTVSGNMHETANFILALRVSLAAKSMSVAKGSSVSDTATISGLTQVVTLTVSGLPKGATVIWAKNPISDSPIGTSDKLSLKASSASVIGTYTVTVTATGANGQKAVFKITLKIT